MAPFDWAGAGWFERAMAKLFDERERAAAEFLVGGNPKWSRQYKSACLVCLFLLTFVAMFGGYDRFMVFFPAYILLTACVPLLDDKWPGLVPLPTGGVFAPLYSVYPVGYDDIARVLLKVNLFRCLLALPLLALFGALGGWKAPGYSALDGVLLAAKTAAMAAALQPVVVVIRVSSATNDTKRAQLKWALILAPTTLAMIAIGYACFTSSGFGVVAGSVTLNALFATGILMWQRRAYNSNKIDLLSKQAPGT